MKTNTLKIIIVDDDVHMHDEYKNYFKTYQDFELCGMYFSVKEALFDYGYCLPDIIVSKVALPEIDGIDAIRYFRKKNRNVHIIMMSPEPDFEIIKKAFKNGANGYLTCPVSKKRLHKALNSIKYEGATMSNDIVKKVISNFHRKSYQFLSDRENEIIDYLCKGATYKIIADKLFVTTSTINFHIQNIYLKLNVSSKSEALSKLREL